MVTALVPPAPGRTSPLALLVLGALLVASGVAVTVLTLVAVLA